ncbi:MAG: hypothetical protein AVDCRST_MAG93-1421 [uncultured Chloroflexia bacterium]|uniref:Uncharacterized protein n=1 Tax=uncultured Chloroflexia bacterium TaxID=1672391 RepID=A0A6J4I7F0_9CHLR|nr:MAG: hypothetical protein AVDCRST_MAG93-1421 [uncultured Chloroflexia bacterium]
MFQAVRHRTEQAERVLPSSSMPQVRCLRQPMLDERPMTNDQRRTQTKNSMFIAHYAGASMIS